MERKREIKSKGGGREGLKGGKLKINAQNANGAVLTSNEYSEYSKLNR